MKIAHEDKSSINLFKQIGVQYNIELLSDMKYIEEIIDNHISAKIQKIKIYDKCVLVIGQIISGIEYITNEDSLHYIEHIHFFSTYITINDSINYIDENLFKVSIIDRYVKEVDKDRIFQSILLLIHTKPEAVLNRYYSNICMKEDNGIDICKINYNLLDYNGKVFRTESLYNKVIRLSDKYPKIKKILSTLVEPNIISYKVINTIEGISEEGQRLSGKVLMVEMNIGQKILYVAENKESIHGLEDKSLHIAYIVIPSFITNRYLDFLIKNHFMNIKIQEEFTSARKINGNRICTSINLYVEVSCENDT